MKKKGKKKSYLPSQMTKSGCKRGRKRIDFPESISIAPKQLLSWTPKVQKKYDSYKKKIEILI